MLASYLACAATTAAGQRNLEFIDLSCTSTQTRPAKRERRFAKRNAIVRMIGGSPADFNCLLGARIGEIKALSDKSQTPGQGSRTQIDASSDEFYDPASKTFTAGPVIRNRSSHTATLVVTTVTSLIATPSSSTFGQTVNRAASVTSAFGTPTWSVHFLDGSMELGSAELAHGQASIDVTRLSFGSHSLKAVYAGDGISSGSVSSVVTQIVGGTATTTSLSLSPNPSQFGSIVTMAASVSETGEPITAGTVVFSDAGKQIASADVANGSASAQRSNLSIGQHPITATYSGSGNWQGSTSATVTYSHCGEG
jgi:hypothetical protein